MHILRGGCILNWMHCLSKHFCLFRTWRCPEPVEHFLVIDVMPAENFIRYILRFNMGQITYGNRSRNLFETFSSCYDAFDRKEFTNQCFQVNSNQTQPSPKVKFHSRKPHIDIKFLVDSQRFHLVSKWFTP